MIFLCSLFLTMTPNDSLNINCYNALSDRWDRMPFKEFLPQKILELHDPKSGMKALEIGSGTGQFASWLQVQGFEVQCIDPSEKMVKRCINKGLSTFQVRLQDFSPKETFGLVSAILSLIHLQKGELPFQLNRIASWINPNGTLILALIEGKGEGIGERESSHPRFFSYYTKEEILELTRSSFDCIYYKKTNGYLIFILKKKSFHAAA